MIRFNRLKEEADMDSFDILKVRDEAVGNNTENAEKLRQELKEKGIFFLNVMASPGSGKTTLLVNLVNRLKKDFNIGVMEADIDGAEDAATVAERTGVKTVQIHTSGACHMTCKMVRDALDGFKYDGLDFIILENIGNLVCPAEFDTGASANLVILSVPEGDDKPIKYPLMFEVATAVAVTKTDVSPAFDFSKERAEENIRLRNKTAPVFFLSAVKDEGIDEIEAYLRKIIADWRE